MKLYNTFTGGIMNKDIDVRLLPKNVYLDAKNVRIVTNDSNNSRTVKPVLGTTVKTALSLGANAETVGTALDTFRNKIYWAVASDSGSYVCEYDVASETENIVLSDTRSGANNLFGFSSGDYVDMQVLNDNENGKNYLIITSENSDEPKFFEIEAGKALTDSSFDLEDVSLIKAPPSTSPTLSLQTGSGQNNIESKFLSFATRFQYQNGEWSALSPFSEFAFFPQSFSYNYKSGTNSAMFNNFASVNISIPTGSSNVTDIQLIVKESGSNTAYIVENYNKSANSWSDDSSETVSFDNSRIYQALDANQLTRVYDNVPINAATVELIGNRIVFGNYTEGYDLSYSGSDINPNFALSYTSASGSSGTAHEQVKTNRDYEIAIAYTDGKGRQTTPITAPNNTTYVPYSVANEKVQLQLTIDSNMRPPDWATGYKLYLKQSKVDFDVIAPITFYRDGIFAWIKLEGNDTQKVAAGDFIFVKSDTAGLQSSPVRTKVLEVSTQERNFIDTTETTDTLQEAGNYMRVEVDGYNLSTNAVDVEEWVGYSFRSSSTSNNLDPNSVTYTEGPFFDGTGLDDMSTGGTLTGNADIRFEIEIDGTGSPNTFRWRSWDVSADPNSDGYGAWTSGVSITGGAQTLSNGITVTFAATTGHTSGDAWYLSAKAGARVEDWDEGGSVSSDGRRAIILLQSKDPAEDESIKAGATIVITYDDSASSSAVDGQIGYKRVSLSSTKEYANIEEWFYGDAIYNNSDFLEIAPDSNDVLFRRGTLDKSNGEQMTVTSTLTDRMYMAILSPCNYTGSGRVRIDNSLTITEFENNIIFETIPTDTTTDIFYELPYTYSVSGGVHLSGGGTDQIFGSVDAVITLDYFNSFGWYNGFESYKIGDTFNEKTMVLDTKPLVPVDNYQQIQRIASLTYSDVYEATTQFNALNEFNLAEVNYKDMDIKYGPIRKLYSEDTNLEVYQEDKTHYVLFAKSVLFNGDGTGNVSQSNNVLGQEVAYTGDYGIGSNPESFATFGKRRYHLDKERGVLLRLSVDGYTEISQRGMHDYFRTLSDQTQFVGGYDPYNDEYLLNVAPDSSPLTLGFSEKATAGGGFTVFYEYQPERLVGINNRLYGFKAGQIWLHDDSSTRNTFYGDARSAVIQTVFNDAAQDVKTFKSINLEADSSSWSVALSTNQQNGTIATSEWDENEGEYYAYLRQGEDTSDNAQLTEPLNVYAGVGEVASYAANVATFAAGVEIPRGLAIGDSLYRYDGVSSFDLIGVVSSYTTDSDAGVTITVSSTTNTPTAGQLIVIAKEARVEGEAIKGYYLDVTLTNSLTTEHELYAVKVEASRSFD